MSNNGFLESLEHNKSNKNAVYDYARNKRYSYNDLYDRASALHLFLVNELKLKKGDRIGFLAKNSIEFIDAFYASCMSGIVITTYNGMLKENELISLINSEEPSVLFYDESSLSNMREIKKNTTISTYIPLSGLQQVIEKYHYEDILTYKAKKPLPYAEFSQEDTQMLIHTGGTTGTPKAAKISFRSFYYNALSQIMALKLTPADTSYVSVPFFHTASWNIFTLSLLYCGGTVLLHSKFDPAAAVELLKKEQPSVMMAVPYVYKKISNCAGFDKVDFGSFRFMLSGAAATPYDVMEKYWDKGVKLSAAYGMTEIGPNNLSFPIDDMTMETLKSKWSSVGKPLPFNHLKIVDDSGNEVPIGTVGHLISKSKLGFSGYWNQTHENIIDNGWVQTGDLAKVDEDGFYYIAGRQKNMFISGGENIFPFEIENAISSHPLVEEVCVFGVEDEKWGEVGKALIVLKNTKKEAFLRDINTLLKESLCTIKIPKYIEVVPQLPRNSAGKIELNKLKSL